MKLRIWLILVSCDDMDTMLYSLERSCRSQCMVCEHTWSCHSPSCRRYPICAECFLIVIYERFQWSAIVRCKVIPDSELLLRQRPPGCKRASRSKADRATPESLIAPICAMLRSILNLLKLKIFIVGLICVGGFVTVFGGNRKRMPHLRRAGGGADMGEGLPWAPSSFLCSEEDSMALEKDIVRASKTPLQFKTTRSGGACLTFEGELSWDGTGSYVIDGILKADRLISDASRSTGWLEYGGESESWKKSGETGTAGRDESYLFIRLTGKLALGEKLEVRLGSWQDSGVFGIRSVENSDKQQYVIS